MRIHIEALQCEGHGRCAAAAPGVYKLDDDGFVTPTDFEVPPGSEDLAKEGAAMCPMGAITIVP